MPDFLVGVVYDNSELTFSQGGPTTKVGLLGIADALGPVDAIEKFAQHPGQYFAVEARLYPVVLRVDEEQNAALEVDVP